jgi:RHS repeat-associated protein
MCGDGTNIGNVLDYAYSFDLSTMNSPCLSSFTSPTNNGDVASITNKITSARSQNFCYDPLNRILQAETTSTTGQYCWGEQYSYDKWANLLSITAISPQYNGCTQESGFNFTGYINGNNQIAASGFTYDAAGDITHLPSGLTATYNAEGRLCSVGGTSCSTGTTYSYDGNGHRVEKLSSTSKLYWYGGSGNVLDESDTSGNVTDEYVFFGGKRVARRDSSNNVDYYFADHLGTARVVTNSTGTLPPLDDSDFYPFGVERPAVGPSSGNTYKFTGKERDSESGLDNFTARYDSSQYGRFLSPDPKSAGADPKNPQSWNMYSYVLNDPLNATDPNGLWCVWEDNTHDDDHGGGGASPSECQDQGGHWDNSDTLLGVTADENGNITSFSTFSGNHPISDLSTVQLDLFLAHANDPNAPQVSAVPRDCSLLGRIWDATSVNPKVGVAVESGQINAEVAASYDSQTESWAMNAGADIFGFGPSASRPLSSGNQNRDLVDPNPNFAFNTPVTQTNVMTAQTSPSVSKTFKVGLAIGVGADASFNLGQFDQSGAACKR